MAKVKESDNDDNKQKNTRTATTNRSASECRVSRRRKHRAPMGAGPVFLHCCVEPLGAARQQNRTTTESKATGRTKKIRVKLVSFFVFVLLIVMHFDPNISCKNCVYVQTAQSSYQFCSMNSNVPGHQEISNPRTAPCAKSCVIFHL